MSLPARHSERSEYSPEDAVAKLREIRDRLPLSSTANARIEIVTTRKDFDGLEEQWNALFERAGESTQLFQSFNWLWHWANHFLAAPGEHGPQLSVVAAHIDDRLVMVWPLVVERVGGVKVLTWMGDPVSQYGDVLIDDIPDRLELLRKAWGFLTHNVKASVVQLRRVRADAAIAPLLDEVHGFVTAELEAPFLDLASAPSFDEYEKRYSSSARRNRKRQRRRLEERGAITLGWHTSGAEAEALTAEAFRLKRQWFHHRGVLSSAFADLRTDRFFADVVRAETHPAGCHVLNLMCGDRPVALEIGVRQKGRSAIHIIVYDLEFEKTGAGSLLMEDSIRHAKDDGMTVFDLLAPGDGYKREWADSSVVVRDWAMPISMFGRAYAFLYLDLFRNGLKRLVNALPVGARRRLTGALERLGKAKA